MILGSWDGFRPVQSTLSQPLFSYFRATYHFGDGQVPPLCPALGILKLPSGSQDMSHVIGRRGI